MSEAVPILEAPRRTLGKVLYAESSFRGKSHWVIQAKPHVAIKLKRLFPRIRVSDGTEHGLTPPGSIMIADTPEVARDIEWVLDRWPMEMDELVSTRLGRQADRHRETETAIEQILTGGKRLDGLGWREPALTPYEYQTQASDIVLATGRLLLLDALGLGKSFSGLLMYRNPETLPGLIVVPTHLPHQWLHEMLNKFFPELTGHIIRTGPIYDPAKTREMKGHDPDVLIISYSKIAKWVDYLTGRVRSVIWDEIQELRRDGSLKYAAAVTIARGADFNAGLTATPVYNYGSEIFNVVNVLAPDTLGTRDEFSREWGVGEKAVREPRALGAYLRDQGVALRRTRKDVKKEIGEDPIRIVHEIDADEDVIDKLTEGSVGLAEMLIKRNARPEDLWRGGGDFDWRMRHATGVSKAPYVAEFTKMLVESGSDDDEQNERSIARFGRPWRSVILFGWHHDVYDIWEERLAEFQPMFYTGRESGPQKERAKQRFIGGDTPLLIMSLRSGTGIDGLQKMSNTIAFGELDWSPGYHDQDIGRLDRPGQEFAPVTAYFLVSDHGSDPVVSEVLGVKRMQSEAIRDPDQELLGPAHVPDSKERVQRLAADFLRRRAERVGHGVDQAGGPQHGLQG